jgi:predicted enzyme related to lactoylglutathione lyase
VPIFVDEVSLWEDLENGDYRLLQNNPFDHMVFFSRRTTMSHQPRLHSFCWVELAAGDTEMAKKFYQGLFNWNYQEDPLPKEMGGSYIQAKVNGDDVAAAMFTLTADMKAMRIPPHWGSYVLVENCDESVKIAKSLGAIILKDSFDMKDAGRMAVIQDPCGSVFHLWQKNSCVGATARRDQHGAFCWQELMVTDPQKACDFYAKLFGWTFDTKEFEGTTYHSIINSDGQPFGGIMSIPKEMPNIPPHWGVYFTINNLKTEWIT